MFLFIFVIISFNSEVPFFIDFIKKYIKGKTYTANGRVLDL
jgi:hypothetical protein